jgi:acyl-CoA dehydrogenase
VHATTQARLAFDAWRERTHSDWFADDPHLRSLLALHGLEEEDLPAFAGVCAREIDALVRENNRDEHLPSLRRYDAVGQRTEAIVHHPTYASIGRLAYAGGLVTRYGERGGELWSLSRLYLFAQNGEAGHACPIACTAGLIKLLRESDNPHPEWMRGLLDPRWDHHLRAAQFLTEVQGGSDVGANAVIARSLADGRTSLTGEGPGTAAVRGYVVPRRRSDGSLNGFYVRRLKYKLGTRSMASAEVDFVDAEAVDVGDFHRVMEQVINTSRLLNAVCCGAILQRAAREADAYARVRTAFGQPVIGFPSVARRLADLWALTYGAKGLTFALGALTDRVALGRATPSETRARRMLLNLNKVWTSETCTTGVRWAIEILGGNGAIEEFSVLPRLLRDSVVMEAWEGGHNVLYSQILRDAQRMRLHVDVFAWLRELGGPSAALDAVYDRWQRALQSEEATWQIRDLCAALRPAAQAAALFAERTSPRMDPRSTIAAEHLLASAPGRDPLDDSDLATRVQRLLDRK